MIVEFGPTPVPLYPCMLILVRISTNEDNASVRHVFFFSFHDHTRTVRFGDSGDTVHEVYCKINAYRLQCIKSESVPFNLQHQISDRTKCALILDRVLFLK